MFRYKCELFRVKIWNDGAAFKQSEQRYLNCSVDFIGQFWKSLTNSDIAFKKLDIYVKGWGKGSKKETWIRRLSTCRFASQVSATPEAGPDWGFAGKSVLVSHVRIRWQGGNCLSWNVPPSLCANRNLKSGPELWLELRPPAMSQDGLWHLM